MDRPTFARITRESQLAVSPNGRYLVDQMGAPFFYLADTAWTLFKRLDRDEVDRYLLDRAAKGFTVIQAYLLRGLDVPNRGGHVPLVDRDPTRLNEGFFGNVDAIVDRANDLGLVIGLVATMGEHVKHRGSTSERFAGRNEQIFDAVTARAYGELVGARYRDRAVIWLLGGDRAPSAPDIDVWDAMAGGLKAGSQERHLVSYHSSGGRSSSEHFHAAPWLDFNTVQSRHGSADPNYRLIEVDYGLSPVKPSLDMESRYEDHPDGTVHDLHRVFAGEEEATVRIDAFQVREAAHWAVFAGAAGHGYGHNSIWQMHDPRRVASTADYSFPLIPPTIPWYEAIDAPGATCIGHLRRLVEARPWYLMEPDQSLIVDGQSADEAHVQAARATDGSFILAYLTFGNPISVDLERMSGATIRASWWDPRTGSIREFERFARMATRRFEPPTRGMGNDWVLVLDDADRVAPIE